MNHSEFVCDSSLLLAKFNSRELSAFGEVYLLYSNELVLFSRKFYNETEVEPSDAVHDVFLRVWKSKHIIFESLEHIKAYLYVMIKNEFKNFVKHAKRVDIHHQRIAESNDYYVSQIVESEVLTIIHQAMRLLPEECAKVFRMHLDGWSVKEIAVKLGKAERTVFIQKQKSISILKEKLPKEFMEIILTFIS